MTPDNHQPDAPRSTRASQPNSPRSYPHLEAVRPLPVCYNKGNDWTHIEGSHFLGAPRSQNLIEQTVPTIAIFGTVGKAPSPIYNGSSPTIDTMPTTILGTVPPIKPRNADVRPREYLTPNEVELLMKVARKQGRYGHRVATLIAVGAGKFGRAEAVNRQVWRAGSR